MCEDIDELVQDGTFDNIMVLIELYQNCIDINIKKDLKNILIHKRNIIDKVIHDETPQLCNSDDDEDNDNIVYQTLEIFEIINGC